MWALLKMCLKQTVSSSPKEMVFPALMLVALVAMTAQTHNRFAFLFLYAGAAWVLVDQSVVLRIKERKERWYHFLIAMSGYSWLYPLYLYAYAISLSAAACVCGLLADVVIAYCPVSYYPPVDGAAIVSTSVLILFMCQVQLVISEVVDVEKVVTVHKLSVLIAIGLGKAILGLGSLGAHIMTGLVALAVVFNFGGVFWIAAWLFRRRSVLT